ncbi:MAG: Flp family type IVb pilin [Ilumatobacteraceae bacterium]
MKRLAVSIQARLATLRSGDDDGASMVEYGLLVGLIAVAAVTVLGLLGDELVRLFDTVVDKLSNAGN